MEQWVFECFIAWLYTGKFVWEQPSGEEDATSDCGDTKKDVSAPGNAKTAGTRVESDPGKTASAPSTGIPQGDQSADADTGEHLPHERLDDDPVTWSWCDLFDLYIFADQYDTRRFRNAVMRVIQTKALQTEPRTYTWASWKTMPFSRLPDSSKLSKFWLDAIAYDMCADPLDECKAMQSLPKSIMAKLLSMLMQLGHVRECKYCQVHCLCEDDSHPDIKSRRPLYDKDLCAYHEHATPEEEKLCRSTWVSTILERGISQEGTKWKAHLSARVQER